MRSRPTSTRARCGASWRAADALSSQSGPARWGDGGPPGQNDDVSTDVAGAALALAARAGVPVLLWGSPGTGKTSAVRDLAEALGWPCEVVIASLREPSDFAGLPVVVDGEVRFAPPTWARRLAAVGHGLLFLDELTTAPPAVQAALLRVVLERVVGDLALPDDVAVVAAANPPGEAADGWDLAPPLANRFCHVDWDVDPRAWASGLELGFPVPATAVLPADWTRSLPAARSLVATFVRARPELALVPPLAAAEAGRAWPSPRTWDMASRLWAAAAAAGVARPVASRLVTGAVGDGAGSEFLAWVDELDLPDPEAVLADPASFELPDRPDRAHAALGAIAAVVAAHPTPERWAAGWKVLGVAGERLPDVAATAARTLAACRPEGAPPPPELQVFLPVLREAGLV